MLDFDFWIILVEYRLGDWIMITEIIDCKALFDIINRVEIFSVHTVLV